MPVAPPVTGLPVVAEIVRSGFVEGHHYGSIVALAADFADPSGPWKTNAAPGQANGGGFRTSTSAGFGMLDALAAVRLAESWDAGAPKTEANILKASAAGAGFAATPASRRCSGLIGAGAAVSGS